MATTLALGLTSVALPASADTVSTEIETVGGENRIAVSPDGSTVLFTSADLGITIYDVESQTSINTTLGYSIGSFEFGQPVFANDGASFYVPDRYNSGVVLGRTSDGTSLGFYAYFGSSTPAALALNGDGTNLAISLVDGTMIVLDFTNGFGAPFAVSSGAPHQICLSGDGNLAFVPDGPNDEVVVVDIFNRSVIGSLTGPLMNSPVSCTVDDEGIVFIGDSLQPRVHRFDGSGIAMSSELLFDGTGAALALSVVCGQLYVGNYDRPVIDVLDAATVTHLSSVTVPDANFTPFSGSPTENADTAWIGGVLASAGGVGVDVTACDPASPPAQLAETGGDASSIVALALAALVVIGAGLVAVAVRRRMS